MHLPEMESHYKQTAAASVPAEETYVRSDATVLVH